MNLSRESPRPFDAQFREVCEELGLTFQDAADRMGVSGSYISQVLRRQPKISQIERIADALGIDPGAFDIYHVLTFEPGVKAGVPLARQYGALMVALANVPDGRRSDFLSETLARASRLRKR